MKTMPPLPLTHDVVLIGGGHTHALVLRKWGMAPLHGARLTLINPGPTAPYSGMLPGHVAGHYAREALDIDLVRLARFAGARLIVGAAEGIDLAKREVHVPGRAPIGFDLCSVDVGITSAMPAVPGFDAHGVPAKPLGRFADAWRGFLDRGGPGRVVVIGAGVAGVELSMAMAHALREKGRSAEVTLIDRSAALQGPTERSRAVLRRALDAQGVRVLEQTEVSSVDQDGVTLTTGQRIGADFICGAAGARPHGWIADTGLALEGGFITVGADLRSSDASVFAVGDCAHMSQAPRPKAGVYAVRQAPVLFHNLRAALTGKPARRYYPQGDYLKLISLGGKRALADRFGVTLHGGLMWRWKNRIDQKFMGKFRDLPAMETPPLPSAATVGMAEALGAKPMCGGCGAKVGAQVLGPATAPARGAARADVINLPGDDAAEIRLGDARQVITSDHLRAFCDDPVMMTRIAAVHALGDIWAMGAEPQAAVVNLILPRQTPPLQTRMLNEIMAEADRVLARAGVAIAGGHTTLGDELTIGFTLTGLCAGDPITLGGGQVGDALILTKPIGSGVLMAGEMAGKAAGETVLAAWETMSQPQGEAARLLAGCARAMTDVTGFGLAGHALNMARASACGVEIALDKVPLMEGALALSKAGVRSTLFPDNRALVPGTPMLPDSPRVDLLFDPQTGGGLLAAVPEDAADAALTSLVAAGYPAAQIGRLVQGPAQITLRKG